MKNENYITVLGWMINELQLSGNKLILYALIYGFSQDGKSRFKGSMKYLADSVGLSKQSVLERLKWLTEKKLIKKFETGRGRNKKCDYGINLDTLKKYNISGNESTPMIGQESLPIKDDMVKKVDQCGQDSLPMIGQESLHHINIREPLKTNIKTEKMIYNKQHETERIF